MLLYKLMRTAVAARPGRTEIVIDRDNFPTDRYLAMGVAAECGLTIRWLDVDTAAGATVEQVAAAVGEQTALVALSHVSYRSAWIADVPAITRIAHDAGALVLWDLCHSVGLRARPSSMRGRSTWRPAAPTSTSTAGPGSPAFCYVAERHLDDVHPADPGLDGQHRPVPDGPGLRARSQGIRRFLSGTPAVVGMLAIQDMVALIDEAGHRRAFARSPSSSRRTPSSSPTSTLRRTA